MMPTTEIAIRPWIAGNGRRGSADGGRTIIVSNRLPLTATIDNGSVRLRRSSGGLATGLREVHQRGGGLWIGWAGADLARLADAERLRVHETLGASGAVSVPLAREEVGAFYERVANGGLWPALHDGLRTPVVDPADWDVYVEVNRRYADAVARHVRPGDVVWVHDYHLMLVPRLVRERCPRARVGFFLHTPFPSPETFASLPHAAELLDGVLGADVVGLHTRDYARSFLETVSVVRGYATGPDWALAGGRRISVVARPMGIDVRAFAARAAAPGVAAEAKRIRADGTPLFVGVDRLDYTKGVPQRLLAFERLLAEEPVLRGRARMLQLAVPSREGAAGYPELRQRVEEIVERVNALYGSPGYRPVRYEYRSVDDHALAALYRAADVMVVTPLRDGMNLVAKEFVASRVDGDGVLVLSERAGAAHELRSALLVAPDDVEELAAAYRAALEMSRAERRVRMRRLRVAVHANDVADWAASFLGTLRVPGGRRLA